MKVIRMLSAIHQDGLTKSEMKALEKASKKLYRQHFGVDYRLLPVWAIIPKGQAYLAGKPSTASAVTIAVADGTDNQARHRYMTDFCNMWMEITGCSQNEIIFNVPDKQVSDGLTQKQIDRISKKKKTAKLLVMALHMLRSKLIRGYFSVNINL